MLSFSGFGSDYGSYETVDEVADYTDMVGAATEQNLSAAKKNEWLNSPAKSLVVLWFIVLALYVLTGLVFRSHLR